MFKHTEACAVVEGAPVRGPSGVRWDPQLDSDFDEWSVKMFSLSVSSSPVTGKDSLCTRLGHTWGVGGLLLHVSLLAWMWALVLAHR